MLQAFFITRKPAVLRVSGRYVVMGDEVTARRNFIACNALRLARKLL